MTGAWRGLLLAVLAFGLVALSLGARGQGCVQCRDNAGALPARTKAAYRRAITLLVLSAGALVAGTVYIVRKNP